MALQINEVLAAGRVVAVAQIPAALGWAGKLQATVGDAGLAVEDAYLRVDQVTVGRNGCTAAVWVYRDASATEVLRSESVYFARDLDCKDNAIRQAYMALRGRYPDAKDV